MILGKVEDKRLPAPAYGKMIVRIYASDSTSTWNDKRNTYNTVSESTAELKAETKKRERFFFLIIGSYRIGKRWYFLNSSKVGSKTAMKASPIIQNRKKRKGNAVSTNVSLGNKYFARKTHAIAGNSAIKICL